MTKSTSPGWPEPNDWVNTLADEMRARLEVYEAESNFELKRNKAAAYLGRLSDHLQQLPPFKSTDLLVPIKDLLIFIHSLESGSGHPWAKPQNFGGTNAETVAETEVRIWVVMGVWSLIEGGYRANAAYKFLAQAMTASGRGRKGKTFSHRNVQRWWLAYAKRTDPRLDRVDQHITNYWAAMPCPHGHKMFDCPSSENLRCSEWRAVAEEFAAKSLKVANFRDWFISPSKNEPL